MAMNLKSYEGQAKVSMYLGVLGVLGVLGAIVLLARNFSRENFWIAYRGSSMWLPLLLLAMLVAVGAGVVGFFLSLHSAGQRRNTRSDLSWRAFFLNALVITLALSVGVFFWITRYPMK
jgi:hypothetical protein